MPFGFVGAGTLLLGAAGITAAGGIASSIIGADAATEAANKQIAAGQEALGAVTSIEQPFISAGTNALAQLQKSLGIGPGGTGQIDPTPFQGSPGYQFAKTQGIDAIQNSAAASGGVQGGNTLKALDQFGTGLANQDFGNYLASLQNLVTGGQSAAGGVATASGNIIQGIGNAGAAGTVGAANAVNAGIGTATGAVNNLSQLAFLSQLLNRNPASGATTGGF